MKKILVIGSLNIDTTFKCEHLPLKGETISAQDVSQTFGGKGANQANVIGTLGGSISMIGAVGNDENGKKMINRLKTIGVNTKGIKKVNESTGAAYISVSKDADNFIIIVSGANSKVTSKDIDNNIKLISKSDIVMLQLELPIETVLYAAKVCKSLGKTVFLDPAPAIPNLDEEIYKYIDFIKPNEKELLTLVQNMEGFSNDITSNAGLLLKKGVKNVIVSLGEKGAMLVNQNGVIQKDAFKVKAIDTTAAGDTFIASFAYYYALDKSIEECFDFAMKASALSTTKNGAFSSAPTLSEINHIGEL